MSGVLWTLQSEDGGFQRWTQDFSKKIDLVATDTDRVDVAQKTLARVGAHQISILNDKNAHAA